MASCSATSVLIRVDSDQHMGAGHFFRMIALGEALRVRGIAVAFAMATSPSTKQRERLDETGIVLATVDCDRPGGVEDGERTAAICAASSASALVVDGYHFDSPFYEIVRGAVPRLMVVDDYGFDRSWDADWLLNHNLFAPRSNYRNVNEDCRMLLGESFALLRREFQGQGESYPKSRSVPRLLITLGGSAAPEVLRKVVRALEMSGGPDLEVVALDGTGTGDWVRTDHRPRHAITALGPVADMTTLFGDVDAVISAGGGTCYEWLYYQLPAAVVVLAPNQVPVAQELERRELAPTIGNIANWDHERAVEVINRWIRSWTTDRRNKMSVVDGLGAHRAAAAIDLPYLWLRPATIADVQQYFLWATDPTVRKSAFNSDAISRPQHVEWFENKLDDQNSLLLIALTEGEDPVGQIRLDQVEAGTWQISYSVASESRGRGFGSRLISLGLFQLSAKLGRSVRIVALVKQDNPASLRVFRKLGFDEQEIMHNGIASVRFETTVSPWSIRA